MTANYRAAPGQMFTFTNEWNRVSLAEGEFYTRLYRVIAETQFNPRIALVNNVQYDSQSAVIGWQSRFRWTVTPGQRFLFRLHPQLAGRSVDQPDLHAGPPAVVQDSVYAQVLSAFWSAPILAPTLWAFNALHSARAAELACVRHASVAIRLRQVHEGNRDR